MILLGLGSVIIGVVVLLQASISTSFGPWISPFIVLLFSLFLINQSAEEKHRKLVILQSLGSLGGLIATGIGFTFPMLFFLDRTSFDAWLGTPSWFFVSMGFLVMVAGGVGTVLGRVFAPQLLYREKNLPFPVPQLIYNTIVSQDQKEESVRLVSGFSLSWLLYLLRDGLRTSFFAIPALLPARAISLMPSIFGPGFLFMINPMVWSVGFMTGMTIVFPLMIGMLSYYAVVWPLNHHSLYLPFTLFPVFEKAPFLVAFCSGLILTDLVESAVLLPKRLMQSAEKNWRVDIKNGMAYFIEFFKSVFHQDGKAHFEPLFGVRMFQVLEPWIILIGYVGLMWYCQFPLLSGLFLLAMGIFATYEIVYLGGKIGLIVFGRFVTFVMLPAVFMFHLTPMQLTILCMFAAVSFAAAANLVFQYRIADYFKIEHRTMYRVHWLGLMVISLIVGVCLWFLVTNLQLGSVDFFAQRGRMRALMLQSLTFNVWPMICGLGYGFIIKRFSLSPAMVFGGLLMPHELTIGFVVGALLSMLTSKASKYYSFASGAFASEVVWLVTVLLCRLI